MCVHPNLHICYGFITAGTLELRIIDGEKIVEGSGENIFGTGIFESSVEVICGAKLLARSVVKSAMLECRVGQRRWDGFDSFLKPMVITPHMPAVISIKVFECNREKRTEILGESTLNLVDIIPGKSNSEILPIVKTDEVFLSGMGGVVGKVHVRTTFTPFESSVIGADVTVAIPENISNNKGSFSIGVGYNTVLQDKISTSLAMFNKEGNFVDAVSLNKLRNTKGLPACYEPVIPHVGYLQDKHEISFEVGDTPDNIKFLFLVLSDYTEFGSLENLKDVYVRIKENKCMTELYRYQGFSIDRPATSGMLLRMVRDDVDPTVSQLILSPPFPVAFPR